MIRPPPRSTLFPYTPLSRSPRRDGEDGPDPRQVVVGLGDRHRLLDHHAAALEVPHDLRVLDPVDRKSTRLNSSHANISYAVFCLKKKTNPLLTICFLYYTFT